MDDDTYSESFVMDSLSLFATQAEKKRSSLLISEMIEIHAETDEQFEQQIAEANQRSDKEPEQGNPTAASSSAAMPSTSSSAFTGFLLGVNLPTASGAPRVLSPTEVGKRPSAGIAMDELRFTADVKASVLNLLRSDHEDPVIREASPGEHRASQAEQCDCGPI